MFRRLDLGLLYLRFLRVDGYHLQQRHQNGSERGRARNSDTFDFEPRYVALSRGQAPEKRSIRYGMDVPGIPYIIQVGTPNTHKTRAISTIGRRASIMSEGVTFTLKASNKTDGKKKTGIALTDAKLK